MTIVSRYAALSLLLLLPVAAFAQAPSGWAQGFHSRVRLVSGGPEGSGHLCPSVHSRVLLGQAIAVTPTRLVALSRPAAVPSYVPDVGATSP